MNILDSHVYIYTYIHVLRRNGRFLAPLCTFPVYVSWLLLGWLHSPRSESVRGRVRPYPASIACMVYNECVRANERASNMSKICCDTFQGLLRRVTTFGAGLLIGTALIVIIPEGVEALYSEGERACNNTDCVCAMSIQQQYVQ